MKDVVDFVKSTLGEIGIKASEQQLTDAASKLTAEAAAEASSEATSEVASEVAAEAAAETALEAGAFQGFGRFR
jgi:hypothetical protein